MDYLSVAGPSPYFLTDSVGYPPPSRFPKIPHKRRFRSYIKAKYQSGRQNAIEKKDRTSLKRKHAAARKRLTKDIVAGKRSCAVSNDPTADDPIIANHRKPRLVILLNPTHLVKRLLRTRRKRNHDPIIPEAGPDPINPESERQLIHPASKFPSTRQWIEDHPEVEALETQILELDESIRQNHLWLRQSKDTKALIEKHLKSRTMLLKERTQQLKKDIHTEGLETQIRELDEKIQQDHLQLDQNKDIKVLIEKHVKERKGLLKERAQLLKKSKESRPLFKSHESPVPDIVITEEPVIKGEPVILEEPAITEPPVAMDPPLTTEAPILTESPVSMERSIITGPPIIIEKRIVTEEPVLTNGVTGILA
jgi:hypothetical protein